MPSGASCSPKRAPNQPDRAGSPVPLAESTDEDGIGAASPASVASPRASRARSGATATSSRSGAGRRSASSASQITGARDSCARRAPPERERVPGRRAQRRTGRRLPRRRAARGRVDRPDAQAPRDDLGGRVSAPSPSPLCRCCGGSGALQMWHLYVVALIIGVATVFFDVSYQSLIPSLVRPNQIAEANGKLQSTYELANIAGPGIGGLARRRPHRAARDPRRPSAPTSISFVALLFTRDHEKPRDAEDRAPILHEIGEGLRWVFGNPLLRRIVGDDRNLELLQHDLDDPAADLHPARARPQPGVDGRDLLARRGGRAPRRDRHPAHRALDRRGASDPGQLDRLQRRRRSSSPLAAMVPSIAFPLLVVQGFVASFTVLLYNITQVTFRQRITPPRLLGRMNASVRFVVWGVMPIAALLVGRTRNLARGGADHVDRRRRTARLGAVRDHRAVLVDARPARCGAGRTGGFRGDTRGLITQPLRGGVVRGIS